MKNKKVLFFGRYQDPYSEKLLRFLRKLFSNVKPCWSKKHNEKIPKKFLSWKGDYIFCFRSYMIVNSSMILNSKYAINFHPGPPNYRGIGCLNFAIYDKAKYFGATAHFINKKIDSGKIIMTKKFRLSKKYNVDKLLKKTTLENYNLAKKIIKSIYHKELNIKLFIKKNKKKWTDKIYYKSDLEQLYEIKLDSSVKKINQIYKATAYKKFKPYFKISDKKIYLNKPL